MKPSLNIPVFFWDLGTMNSRLYSADQGLISDSPTAMVRQSATGRVVFLGREAAGLFEKIPAQLETVKCVERGVIASPLLSVLIDEMAVPVLNDLVSRLVRPTAAAVVPSATDPVHLSALKRAFLRSGFGAVVQIPSAAAVVMSLDPASINQGCMVWDIGAGKTEIAVVSGGNILASRLIWLGGDDLDKMIQQLLIDNRHYLISISDARRLKTSFSFSRKKAKEIYLLGRNLALGKIESLTLSSEEFREEISNFFVRLAEPAAALMANLPPRLLGEIQDKGIILTGGLSQIDGIEEFLLNELKFQFRRNPRQHISPILGASKLWSQWSTYSYLAFHDSY